MGQSCIKADYQSNLCQVLLTKGSPKLFDFSRHGRHYPLFQKRSTLKLANLYTELSISPEQNACLVPPQAPASDRNIIPTSSNPFNMTTPGLPYMREEDASSGPSTPPRRSFQAVQTARLQVCKIAQQIASVSTKKVLRSLPRYDVTMLDLLYGNGMGSECVSWIQLAAPLPPPLGCPNRTNAVAASLPCSTHLHSLVFHNHSVPRLVPDIVTALPAWRIHT